MTGGGLVNAHWPGTITEGDCVSSGVGVMDGLALGTGIGVAAMAIGKLVDAWGIME